MHKNSDCSNYMNGLWTSTRYRHATYCYMQVDLKSFLASGAFFLGCEATERASTSLVINSRHSSFFTVNQETSKLTFPFFADAVSLFRLCNPTWLAHDSKLQPIRTTQFSSGRLRRWLTTSSRVITICVLHHHAELNWKWSNGRIVWEWVSEV